MRRLIASLLISASLAAPALAQSVTQSGSVTPGHPVQWKTNGVVSDAGPATLGVLTGLGVTASGPSICANSGPVTAPYNQICLGATSTGGALSFNNHGGTGTLAITVNGASALGPTLGLGTMSQQNANAVAITGGTITGAAISGGTISNLPTPSAASAAATKNYVDVSALGYVLHNPVRVATTTTLPTYNWSSTGGGTLTATGNGALTIDGVAVSAADRVLVKNELSSGTACNGNINSACDGIYTVSQAGSGGTPYILVRASANNTKGNAENVAAGWPGGDSVLVTAGTVNTGTTWLNTANIATLNTTAFVFTQLSSTTSSPWQISGANIYFAAGNMASGPGAAVPTGYGYTEFVSGGSGASFNPNLNGAGLDAGTVSTFMTSSVGLVGGTINSHYAYNYIQVFGENQGAANQFATASGLYLFMQVGGASSTGTKSGLDVFVLHNSGSPTTSNKGDQNGMTTTSQQSASEGGTLGSEKGSAYGLVSTGVATSGATNLVAVSGGEIHAEIRTGASAIHRWGWSMVSLGDLQGYGDDAAIAFGTAGPMAWKNAFLLTNANGAAPLSTNGCVICTDGTSNTIATGIDISAYNISGNAFKSPGFAVSGGGFLAANAMESLSFVFFDWGGITLSNGLNSNIEIGQHTPVRIAGPTGAFSVGGFILDFGGFSGQLLYLYNTTSQAMTIVNEDASTTASQRITTLTGSNVTLRTGKSFASFVYDTASSRWILMSTN